MPQYLVKQAKTGQNHNAETVPLHLAGSAGTGIEPCRNLDALASICATLTP